MNRALALVLGAVVAAVSCGPREPAPPRDAAGTAIALFAAARHVPLSEPEIVGLVDPQPSAGRRARLLDAVASLSEASNPEAIATARIEDGARTAVDVTASLPGGGRATYTVELKLAQDGSWRVTSFWGPAVGWPERGAPSGDGLTVSPPPR